MTESFKPFADEYLDFAQRKNLVETIDEMRQRGIRTIFNRRSDLLRTTSRLTPLVAHATKMPDGKYHMKMHSEQRYVDETSTVEEEQRQEA